MPLLRCSSLPEVEQKHDASRPFVPCPGPARHRRSEQPPSQHCRFWLSAKQCHRGAACRYLHEQDETQLLLHTKRMIQAQELQRANKVFDGT